MATCTVANLVSTSTSPFASLTPRRRRAVLLYMLARKVLASGGADYLTDPNTLFAASATWRAMRRDQRDAALIEVAKEVAVTAGATISSDINVIAAGLPKLEEFHDDFLLYIFLRCAAG